MRLLFGIVVVVMLSACSSSSEPEGDQMLARFEGGVLTVADVDAHLKRLKRDTRFRDKPELLTPEFAFQHALNMEMIIARGLEHELHRDPVIRDDLHGYMSDQFMHLMQNQLIESIDRDEVSEEDILDFYQKNQEQYQQPARYHLHAFSIKTEQADEAMAALQGGELEFAEAAGRYALKEHEQESGGNTGKRTLRRFQPNWRDIVVTLPVGQVSGPYLIDGETYLLLLADKTEPYQYGFEERREYIRNDVLYSRYQEQWQKVYADLREKYKVKVNKGNLDSYTAGHHPAGATPMLDTAEEADE